MTLGRSSPTISTSKPRPRHHSATTSAASRSPAPPGDEGRVDGIDRDEAGRELDDLVHGAILTTCVDERSISER